MLTLNDGRSELWQWDTGRKLTVDADCSQVHFSNKVFGRSVDVDVVDGIAVIPDILLQTDKELSAWAFVGTPENGYTKISKVFKVNKRNKPADYVFAPTEQTTLGDILDRIEDLENRPSGDVSKEDVQNAVNDYLDKNPVSFEEKDPTVPAWAKKPNKPTYTAAEVGALPADTVIPEGVTDEQIKNAVDAYLMENPPEGGGIPIPPSAQVGQTIVVKAVDEAGKPTEWEAADLPSGGGGVEWKLIGEIITAEEVSDVSIVNDKPLNEMLVYYSIPPIPEDTGGTTYIVPQIIKNGVISNAYKVCRGATKPNTKTARGRWHITPLGGTIQEWNASVASPPDMFIGFREEGMLNILDAHKAGGGLIGFCINWNLGNKFPAGIKLEVWGR